MTTTTIDLIDPDRFVRLEHHEMFTRLRAEDPVHWYDDPDGAGFLEHHEARRPHRGQPRLRAVLVGDRRRQHPGHRAAEGRPSFDTRGVIMLDMDPPKHTRYRLLVNKGFTPRMIGLLEQALRTAPRSSSTT